MNKMLIAIIYYINTYPFNKISCKELPNEFSIKYSTYSLYYYITLLLNLLKNDYDYNDSSELLASTFIIINKLIIQKINLPVNNQHKLFIVSIMISTKILYDECYNNAMWASILNLPIKELNKMEYTILEILKYDIFISKELYDTTLKILMYMPVQKAISEIKAISEKSLYNKLICNLSCE